MRQTFREKTFTENTIYELKIHLLGRKTPIRSQNPREVVQEVYGWLLGHWAVRLLMFQAASQAIGAARCGQPAPSLLPPITPVSDHILPAA